MLQLKVSKGKNVRKKLTSAFEKKQAELKKEEDKIRKKQESFKKQSLVLNDSAKAKKQQEMQAEIYKLQQKTVAYQREIQSMEQKFKRPILEKVKAIVDSISKKDGIDMTIEASAPFVLYLKKSTDITDKVIKAYDKKHPSK